MSDDDSDGDGDDLISVYVVVNSTAFGVGEMHRESVECVHGAERGPSHRRGGDERCRRHASRHARHEAEATREVLHGVNHA